MNQDGQISMKGTAIVLAVIAAVAVVGYVVVQTDTRGTSGSGLGEQFDYDLSKFRKVDPELIGYRQVLTLETHLSEPRGIAIE